MTKQESKNTSTPAGGSHWSEIISLIKSVALFLCIAFFLRASVVEAFKIPSSSMVPTLEIGDHIFVNKLSYGLRLPFKTETVVQFREPKRGDVVVFTLPDNPNTPQDEADTNIIKRIVGLPGDEVAVRGENVYINGEIWEEDKEFAVWQGGNTPFGPEIVPAGHVLLLGDNRDHSRDSRFWEDPFLDIERIKGRAFLIYWNSLLIFNRMFNVIH